MFDEFWLLTLIVFLPVLGALVLAVLPVRDEVLRWITLVVTFMVLALTAVGFFFSDPTNFDVARGDMQNTPKAYEVVGKLVDEMSGGNTKLATAYAASTGMRGEFTDIWALEDSVGDLSFTNGAPEMPIIDDLRQVVDFESVDFINPLPYSKLQ